MPSRKGQPRASRVLSFNANVGLTAAVAAATPKEVQVTSDSETAAIGGSMRPASDPTHYKPTDPVPSTYHLNSGDEYIYRVRITGLAGDAVTLSFSNADPATAACLLKGTPGGVVQLIKELALKVK